jgi:hypothetical protein
MRYLTFLLFCGLYISNAYAQSPVTNGLNLHLDAGNGVTSGSSAIWQDISGAGNNLSSGGGTTNPVYHALVPGTNYPGLEFDGVDDFMESNVPANGWAIADSVTEATLFIVRIADPALNTIHIGDPNSYKALISIADDHAYHHEFGLTSDASVHHNFSGMFCYKTHQCYSNLPRNKPVVLAGRLKQGNTNSDIDYYINNMASVNNYAVPGAPTINYPAIDRMISIGTRYNSGGYRQEFFRGYVLEVLTYNRALTDTEIKDINEWLLCKYNIDYAASQCNNPTAPDCERFTGISKPISAPPVTIIYPNPSYGEINIKSQDVAKLTVTVSNVMGQIVLHDVMTNGTKQLSLQGNLAGIYTIHIQNESSQTVKRGRVTLR